MAYNIEIVKKNQYKTSEWSGGTTTELYIYPKDSMYSERNFKWRLSSAKVVVQESTFTPLPGISRIIMIIKGELQLEHQGHHTATLKVFEQDSFAGDWTTKSFGKVKDFNLMMTSDCSGNLELISINRGELKDIVLHNNMNSEEKHFHITEAFYLVEGEFEIVTEKYHKMKLNEGDLVLVTRREEVDIPVFKFCNCSNKEVKIIKTSIFY